jgi:hypothetical protein
MEAICSSKTLCDFRRTTRRYIPEDSALHTHRCENLRSDIRIVGVSVDVRTRPAVRRLYRVTLYTVSSRRFPRQIPFWLFLLLGTNVSTFLNVSQMLPPGLEFNYPDVMPLAFQGTAWMPLFPRTLRRVSMLGFLKACFQIFSQL